MKPSAERVLQVLLAVALVQACDRDDGPLSPNASRSRAEVTAGAVLSTGTWSALASMPTARFGLAVASGKHGIIYAIGGSSGLSGPIVPAVEAYDQKTGSWSALAPMPTPRRYLMAATDRQGRVYAIGGALAGVFRSLVERYDPATDTWSAMSPLPVARCCGAATTGLDGRIYVIGGFANGNVQLSDVEAYDPETDRWSSLAPLPAPRAGKLSAVTAPDGRIYAMGGINGVTTVATVDAYDPCADTWTPVASMPTPRRFLDAVRGRGGIIYALGGTVGSVGFPGTQELTTVEAYDPSADTWTAVAGLSTPRGALAAAVGRAGTIFAIGGFDGTSVLSSVEAFTPGHLDVGDEDDDRDDSDVPSLRCEDRQAQADLR
ncbi:MAG: hypothetical protein DMD65_13720 [Gemmatimonadetes bacterium]|nr:MAG: hypothetical protein DMD65_13720 [Gemmatimonadota bacterium]